MRIILILTGLLISSASISGNRSKTEVNELKEKAKRNVSITASQAAARSFSSGGLTYKVINPVSRAEPSTNISVHITSPRAAKSRNASAHITASGRK
jgi:hypothetical protein